MASGLCMIGHLTHTGSLVFIGGLILTIMPFYARYIVRFFDKIELKKRKQIEQEQIRAIVTERQNETKRTAESVAQSLNKTNTKLKSKLNKLIRPNMDIIEFSQDIKLALIKINTQTKNVKNFTAISNVVELTKILDKHKVSISETRKVVFASNQSTMVYLVDQIFSIDCMEIIYEASLKFCDSLNKAILPAKSELDCSLLWLDLENLFNDYYAKYADSLYFDAIETKSIDKLKTAIEFNPGNDIVGWICLAIQKPFYESIPLFLQFCKDINYQKIKDDSWTPLIYAICSGAPLDVINKLLDAGADCSIKCKSKITSESNNKTADKVGLNVIMLATLNGRFDYLQLLLTDRNKYLINSMDSENHSPLYYALINHFLEISSFLIKTGADANLGLGVVESPLFLASLFNLDITKALVESGAKLDGRIEPGGLTPLMGAAIKGQSATVEYLLSVGANPNIQDSNGWTAERHAAESRHQNVLDVLQKPQRDAEREAMKTQLTPEALSREIGKRALNLVGFENLIKQMSIDLSDFYMGHESKARIFWGQSAVGKTEFCQRLAGMKQGFPKFQIGPHAAFYVSGIDGKVEIRQFVQQIPNDSILIIDEADKVLDPKAQMVSQSEAVQLQHAIVTYFSTKKIYWVFVGTFSALRGQQKLSYDMLTVSLGSELASRIDFADWEFPQWTLESLLQAVRCSCNRRGLQYDDEALLLVTQHCLSMGGGVRAFDNIDQSLNRKLSMRGTVKMVTKELAVEYINGLGAKIAA